MPLLGEQLRLAVGERDELAFGGGAQRGCEYLPVRLMRFAGRDRRLQLRQRTDECGRSLTGQRLHDPPQAGLPVDERVVTVEGDPPLHTLSSSYPTPDTPPFNLASR